MVDPSTVGYGERVDVRPASHPSTLIELFGVTRGRGFYVLDSGVATESVPQNVGPVTSVSRGIIGRFVTVANVNVAGTGDVSGGSPDYVDRYRGDVSVRDGHANRTVTV